MNNHFYSFNKKISQKLLVIALFLFLLFASSRIASAQSNEKSFSTGGFTGVAGKTIQANQPVKPGRVIISGNAGAAGVTLTYKDVTDHVLLSESDGSYRITVPFGWSGTLSPSLLGYKFDPPVRNFSRISADQPNQDFLAIGAKALQTATSALNGSDEVLPQISLGIAGNTGLGGVTLVYTVNNRNQSVVSDGDGNFHIYLPSGWSGSLIPVKAGYLFEPAIRSYTSLLADQSGQDFNPIAITVTPTPTITPTSANASTPVVPPASTLDETLTRTGTRTVWSGNLILDPSFEESGAPQWPYQYSTNFGTPLCYIDGCGINYPRSGSGWVWLGGIAADEQGYIGQDVLIPTGTATLEFYLWITAADAGSDAQDAFYANIDSSTLFTASALDIETYSSYQLVSLDVSAFADGASHMVWFSSSSTGQNVSFQVDDVSLSPLAYDISGNTGAQGIALDFYVDGTRWTALSDMYGDYSFSVPAGWSGRVTPRRTGYTFSPVSIDYVDVNSNQIAQNYNPTFYPTVTPTRTATPTRTPTAIPNQVKDPGFELAITTWKQTGTIYKPLCKISICGTVPSAKPRSGKGWAWFAGTANKNQTSTLYQLVPFPMGTKTLEFYLWIGYAAKGSDANDKMIVTVDGTTVFVANATQKSAYPGYVRKVVNISKWANGLKHTILFRFVTSGQVINFNVDDVTVH